MNSVVLGLVVPVAAAASASIVWVLLPWLKRHALAHPNSRSSHRESTPQGGGIAVIAAAVVVAAGSAVIGLHEPALGPGSLWLVFSATALIALVGAIDDIRTIEVVPRLLLQTVAVGIMIAWVFTVTFVPAYVMLLKDKSLENFGAAAVHEEKQTWLTRLLHRTGQLTYVGAKPILVARGIILDTNVKGEPLGR